jgi:hypothetical protein
MPPVSYDRAQIVDWLDLSTLAKGQAYVRAAFNIRWSDDTLSGRAPALIGLTLSLCAHALIVAMLWHAEAARQVPPPPLDIVMLEDAPARVRGRLADVVGGASACAQGRWITGIGIEMNARHVVILVPSAYPAIQAGLRLGDIVVNPALEPDAAGYDAVAFTRQGRLHRLLIKTRPICLR